MKTCTSFIPSIDNLSNNVKDVSSILVMPVFGTRSTKPVAILQFVNKLDFKKINNYDVVSMYLLVTILVKI